MAEGPTLNYWVQAETATTRDVHCLSFRGLDKARVIAGCDAFIETLGSDNLISRDPLVRFLDKQYCIFVRFKTN